MKPVKTLKLIIALLLVSVAAIAQEHIGPAFWRLTSVSGEFRMSGLYLKQDIERGNYADTSNSMLLSGGILLNANSYFWHPNFLQVDVGLEFTPEIFKDDNPDSIVARSDNYLGILNQGETRTLKKLDIRTTLFQKKKINLTTFTTLAQNYNNRELLSTIKTNSQAWGGVLTYTNSFLPFSIAYQQGKIDQEETGTGRLFRYENSNLEGRTSRSFGKHDKHELQMSLNEFRRTEREFALVRNTIAEASLSNKFYFDKKQKYRFHSLITAGDQTGYDTLQRLQAFETLTVKLPLGFDLGAHYTYYDIDRESQALNQQIYRGVLSHKLFESLFSRAFYENIQTAQTSYDQTDEREGIEFNYVKKLPLNGILNLGYSQMRQHEDKKGESTAMRTIREEYVLTDGVIVQLKRPFVEINSIVVRDISGTVIYQLNFDYLLFTSGKFIQIQRVPGGQIPNNATVYIDYTAIIPGEYAFDMKHEFYAAGVTFFKQLIGFYYRHSEQSYSNLKTTDFVTLNSFTQQVYGIRSEYKVFSAGVEIDDNNSTILPYYLTRYFLSIQGLHWKRILFSLNGNYSDYHLIQEDEYQQYSDISAQLAYQLGEHSRLNFDAGYRQQSGKGIDLDLLNARLEYSTLIRKLHLTLGVQSFRRDYLQERDNFNGAYFRISRRF